MKKRIIITSSVASKILIMKGAKRVSKEAAIELSSTMEKIAVEIAKDSVRFRFHAGRRTILEEDISLSVKK